MSKLLTLSAGTGEVSLPTVPQVLVIEDSVTSVTLTGNDSGIILNLTSAADIANMAKSLVDQNATGYWTIPIASGEVNESCTLTAIGAASEVIFGFSKCGDGIAYEILSVYANSGSSITLQDFLVANIENVGTGATISVNYKNGTSANLSPTEVKAMAGLDMPLEVGSVLNTDLNIQSLIVTPSASGSVSVFKLRL
jgi:hypothetical protein